jgi:outer membrane biosynthesis protein TonB
MRLIRLLFIALLLAACGRESVPDVTPVRQAIEVRYVGGDTAAVHQQPAEASPVMTTYQFGEALSVLSKQGEWLEVRVADGSGWVRASDTQSSKEARDAEQAAGADTPLTPRFRKAPASVTDLGAHGEIVLEANVSPQGEVLNVRVLSNTTGSIGLEARNVAALQAAKFYPIVQAGERRAFIYEHRVSY